MSPKFVSGDLVLVRDQQNYSIGDAVAYSHPDIGQVFHRIIAFNENGNFLVQGDHNSWVDAYAPSQEEIIGKLWIHIPKIGKTLLALRSPWAFAILVLVFSFLGMKILFPPSKSRHNRGEKMARSTSNIGEKIFLAAILTFLSLILGIFAFQRPVLIEVTTPLSYQQQAVYRYTADVPAGIYDSEQIQPGEPIFRQLNGSFFVSMDYLFILL